MSTGSAFDTSIRPRNPGQFQSSSDFKWIDYYIKIYGLMFMKLLEKCAPLMEWRKNRGGGRYSVLFDFKYFCIPRIRNNVFGKTDLFSFRLLDAMQLCYSYSDPFE